MTQFSVTARNAMLDALETAIGTGAILRLLTGSIPADCAAAQSGTLVAEMTLPSDWLAAASNGSKVKSGTWQDLVANNTGIITYYRILDSGSTTCHWQGPVSESGGGGDLIVDNNDVNAGQEVVVDTFAVNMGGA